LTFCDNLLREGDKQAKKKAKYQPPEFEFTQRATRTLTNCNDDAGKAGERRVDFRENEKGLPGIRHGRSLKDRVLNRRA
jgi:hypothetical protein